MSLKLIRFFLLKERNNAWDRDVDSKTRRDQQTEESVERYKEGEDRGLERKMQTRRHMHCGDRRMPSVSAHIKPGFSLY